jgi:hypothetical protein
VYKPTLPVLDAKPLTCLNTCAVITAACRHLKQIVSLITTPCHAVPTSLVLARSLPRWSSAFGFARRYVNKMCGSPRRNEVNSRKKKDSNAALCMANGID